MSHIVTITPRCTDALAVGAACRRVGIPEPIPREHKLYSGLVTGRGLKLPGWRYPAVIDQGTGEIRFDTYGGEWGKQAELDRFLQAYAAEKAKLEARRAGHTCTEKELADGSLRLTITT